MNPECSICHKSLPHINFKVNGKIDFEPVCFGCLSEVMVEMEVKRRLQIAAKILKN